MTSGNKPRYLAVHPTTYGIGFAVFEEDLRLVDWGAYRARGDKNQRGLCFLGGLIKRYDPHVVLLEDRGPRDRQRSERVRRFVVAAKTYMRNREIPFERIPRRRVREFFEGHGAQTKQGIAARIVEWLPELSRHLPPKRKAWMPEHPCMGMFEAMAFALTYFGSQEISL